MTNVQCSGEEPPVFGFTDPMAASHRIGLAPLANEDVTAEPSYNCSNQCAAPNLERPVLDFETDVPTALDWAIINDSFVVVGFDTSMQWKGDYRVYRKLLRHPAMAQSSTTMVSFKAANDSLSTGKLAWTAEERSKLFTLTPEQDSVLALYRVDEDSLANALATLDEQIHNGDSTNQTTYDALVQQRANTGAELEQMWATVEQGRQQRIQTLLQFNASVNTTMTVDENHKAVNDIVLRFFATDTLAAGDLTTLESIAAQCPLEGGDAVYEARALASSFTGQVYDNNCQPNAGERMESQEVAIGDRAIRIFPNPTSGAVNVSGAAHGSLIRVMDQLGRVVQESVLAGNTFNVGSLQKGLYQLQIWSPEGALLGTEKLLVSKN